MKTDRRRFERGEQGFGGGQDAAGVRQSYASGQDAAGVRQSYAGGQDAGGVRQSYADSQDAGDARQGRGNDREVRDEDAPAFADREVNVRRRDLREKETLKATEKTEVAVYAAKMIRDGDLVYIDAGTTTGSMIDHIDCFGATFVTDGVRHAIRLAQRGLQTYLLSGRVKTSTEAVIGHDAAESLQKYHFSKCFIGTDGIAGEYGLTTADIDESMVKTEAIRRSSEVFVLADSSKFGLVASVTFAPLDAGTIITDRLPDPGFKNMAQVIELHGE